VSTSATSISTVHTERSTCDRRIAAGTEHPPTAILYTAHVRRRDLLGGLFHEYEAAA
jgi:hypothetical protein